MKFFSFISDRIRTFFSSSDVARAEETDDSAFIGREKAIVFGVAFFFSLCLWFIVNLSRDFNVTLEVPIQLVNLPDDVAISSELPEFASVNVTGEGWKLIPLYSNPPRISLSADSRQINLFEQMRSQVGAFSDLNVLQVDPIVLNVEIEEKATKRVPILPNIDLNMQSRYGTVQDPSMEPDSVTLTGAVSKLAEIESWETEEMVFSNVNRSMERRIELKPPGAGVSIEPAYAILRIDVAEFTESEMRIPVRTRNLPSGKAVSFNPSSITIRFDVPIDKFSEVQGTRPFVAYVDYEDIENDETGFVVPRIEKTVDNINVRLRGFQPQRVSYFNILPD
jgi:YbbR domain-containing protein